MLRASSLGLCLPPSAIRGCQQCFLSLRMMDGCATPLTRRATSQMRAVRPFTPSAYSLDENDGRSSDSGPTETTSTEEFLTQIVDGTPAIEEHHESNSGQTPEASTSESHPHSPFAAFTLPASVQHKASVVLGYPGRPYRIQGKKVPEIGRRAVKALRYIPLQQRKKLFSERIEKQRKTLPTPKNELEEQHYITESTSFAANLKHTPEGWIYTLQTTQSAADAWAAYTSLISHPSNPWNIHSDDQRVGLALLHRLARLLARQRPKVQYMRLLAVLTRLRAAGGTVQLHEWNALIDAAGQGGVRRLSVAHYETALSFFRDMTKGREPGTTLELGVHSQERDELEGEGIMVEPDIYTYTTLIGIAARTRDMGCVRHARMLLDRSGIPPNRFTHLALMKYFTATKQPAAVRSTLLRIEQQDLEVGLDGINACLIAYSRNDRLDVVMMIYRLLKHNADPDQHDAADSLVEMRRQLRQEEFIIVPENLLSNEVTYTTMIQIMAYHGNLSATLTVFVDMLSSLNVERGAPLVRDANGDLKPTTYRPTIAIFRAIFLGFRLHGLKLSQKGLPPSRLRKANPPDMPGWTLDNLEKIFETFMGMPPDMQIGMSVFYWLIVAFQKTSGNDDELVRRVWKRVEGRFRGKGPWGGTNNRLERLRASLFPGEGADDGDKPGRPS
ncbi:hypothetical protein FPV67DRAFT_1469999 [Lyophyllum atratum]|nr:hypothetical protein FPV67DRAFT_1469999 [Lyophyllum atratum]